MNNPGTDPANPLPDEHRDDLTSAGATDATGGEHPPHLVAAAPSPAPAIPPRGEFEPIPPPATPAGGPAWGENFQTSWGWLDLILLLVVTIGATLLAGMAVSMAFYARGVTRAQLQDSGMERSLWILITQVGVFAGVLGYLWISVAISQRRPFWQTTGWRPLEMGRWPKGVVYSAYILGGGLLCFMVSVISDVYGTQKELPIQEMFQDRRSALLFVTLAVLLAPLIEETIFRGYIYPVVARTFGMGLGVLLTGTLFGLMHAQQLWGGWVQIAMLVMVGIFFTYARAMTRSVVASYLLHLGYNSFMAVGFLISPLGYRALPLGR
jgi:membrane protease YdiL (CAAX protease family)